MSSAVSSGGCTRRQAGFTLVEVLVALLLMAILAGLSWRALDGILRARDSSRDSVDRTVRLATVLTQWEQDLQSLYDTQAVPTLSFDGQTMRLTRHVEGGIAVVAWAVRNGVWQRWSSPAMTRSAELQDNWLRSQQLVGNEAGQVALSDGAEQWQVYFNRDGFWSNAQSSGNAVAIAAPAATPAASAASGVSGAAGAAGLVAGSVPGGSINPTPANATAVVALPLAVRLSITLAGSTLIRDIQLGPS